MIVVLGSHKGGTGKTTLAFNFAAMRARTGKVKLIDADVQQSARRLTEIRRLQIENNPELGTILPKFSFGTSIGPLLSDAIDEAAQGFDDVVIDTGGMDSQELRRSLVKADVLVSPILGTTLDIGTLPGLDRMVADALPNNPKLRAFLVFNLVPSSTELRQADAIRQIAEADEIKHLGVCGTRLNNLVVFQDSANFGVAVVESHLMVRKMRNPKANDAMEELISEVYGTANAAAKDYAATA